MKKFIFILISLLFLVTNLSAKIIIVTSGADSGEGTLREAITNAEANDTIVFANSVSTVYFAGVIKIDKNITIFGNETNNTIFQDAPIWTDTENKKRFFHILVNVEVTLNHLTLKDHNGNCTGGAILNIGNKLNLNNCTFSNNKCFDYGGAIVSKGILNIDNCDFINNYAPQGGGAIEFGEGELTITNSSFVGNSVPKVSSGTMHKAGAISTNSTTTAFISNCDFEGNIASDGGAISTWGTTIIDNCTFKKNKSTYGGAVQNHNQINIINSIFLQNEAERDGIFGTAISSNATATLTNCSFTNNTITYTYFNPRSHCIISFSGGPNATGLLTLINCTVADNTGTGIGYFWIDVVLYNTVLWNNVSKFNDQYDVCRDTWNQHNGVINAYNSLIGTSNIDLNSNNNIIGETPFFVGNGDYSLQKKSPAIDKGNNSYLPAEITTDLADNPRISNGIVDMGAYEFQRSIVYDTLTLTFAGEEINIEPQTIEEGDLATRPEEPERAGYNFVGWFTDNGTFLNKWNFETDAVTQDTTLWAKWNIKTYTVSFAGESVSIAQQTIKHDSFATAPETPERAGYDFVGWFTNNTFVNEWNFRTNTITQDTTLWAKWNIKTYTVTFSGEGIDIESQPIEHGNHATRPAPPEKEGYNFGGWFTDNGKFLNEWDFETDVVTQDTTLWAKWNIIKTYTVTFSGEWIYIDSQSIKYGNHATRPAPPEKEGYNFVGWFTDNGTFVNEWNFETYTVTQDTTLYAKWTKIIYHPGDIAVINNIIANNGWDLTPANPADGSYIPSNWNKNIMEWADAADNKRVIGLFIFGRRAENVTGTLNVSGLEYLEELSFFRTQLTALNVSGLKKLRYLTCTESQLTAIDLSGLENLEEFICNDNQLTVLDVSGLKKLEWLWCYNNQLTELDLTGLNSLIFFDATNQSVSLTMAKNGGNYSVNIALNNPTGLVAGLSYSTGTLTSNSHEILSSPFSVKTGLADTTLSGTLHFTYTELYATISFAGDGISIPPKNVEHGSLALRPSNPERTGYNFMGWFTDNNTFENEWNFETDIVTQDTTLWAKWEIKTYTVSFAGENISIAQQTIEHGSFATEPEAPERIGYDFMGWFTDNNTFENEWNFETDIVTQDTTLWAKWEIKTYTVSFVGENISIASQTIEHGNLATHPTNPERIGYDFMGWFTDNNTFENEWNFETNVITQDTTLWAKWTEKSGIIETERVNIKVYPNPTTGVLNLVQEQIKNYELKITNVEIFDLTGKTLFTVHDSLFTNSINISHLPSGTYFVKISTNEGEVIKKVIKE